MKKLIIIGNGFDLNCKLDTTYRAFFNFLRNENGFKEPSEILQEKNSKNFTNKARVNIWWALLLSYHNDKKEYLWKDIEQIMLSFLHKKSDEYYINIIDVLQNLDSLIDEIVRKYNTINLIGTTPARVKFLWLLNQANDLRDFYNFNHDHWGNETGMVPKKIDDLIPLLKQDLSVIEEKFSEFLGNLNFTDNACNRIANSTYATLLGLDGPLTEKRGIDLTNILYDTNILSFNFTRLGEPYERNFPRFKNIHGTFLNYDNKEIIFGIDSSGISPEDPIYVFTKTYRVSLLEEKYLQTNNLFNGQLHFDEIIIYGHSLNKQDYAYFYAIFNRSNINDSDTSIILYYSNFNGEDKSAQRSLELQSLIYNYETDYQKPKGLFHRMQFEGRIRIKKL